jgi:hypothetical protein
MPAVPLLFTWIVLLANIGALWFLSREFWNIILPTITDTVGFILILVIAVSNVSVLLRSSEEIASSRIGRVFGWLAMLGSAVLGFAVLYVPFVIYAHKEIYPDIASEIIVVVLIASLNALAWSGRQGRLRYIQKWLVLIGNIALGSIGIYQMVIEFYNGWQTILAGLVSLVAVFNICLIAQNVRYMKMFLKGLGIIAVPAAAIFAYFYIPPVACWKSSAEVHEELQRYNHCETVSDCTIVHGTRCGYQTGLVTNKDELDYVMPIINSCPSKGCIEDTFGMQLEVVCVENRCRYERRN